MLTIKSRAATGEAEVFVRRMQGRDLEMIGIALRNVSGTI